MTTLLSHSEDSPPLLEINTTPLIDVMLVLLIVLILAMPTKTHQTTMDMPRGVSAEARRAITVDIEFDGSLYWNGAPVESIAKVEEYFRSTATQAIQPDVRINASRRVKYEVVAQVLAAAQRNGIQRLGLAGQERFTD